MDKKQFINKMVVIQSTGELLFSNKAVQSTVNKAKYNNSHKGEYVVQDVQGKALMIAMDAVDKWSGSYDEDLWKYIHTCIQFKLIDEMNENTKRMKVNEEVVYVNLDVCSLNAVNHEEDELIEMITEENIITHDSNINDEVHSVFWHVYENEMTKSQKKAVDNHLYHGKRLESTTKKSIISRFDDYKISDSHVVRKLTSDIFLLEGMMYEHDICRWFFNNSGIDLVEDIILEALDYRELVVFNRSKRNNIKVSNRIMYKLINEVYRAYDSKKEAMAKFSKSHT